MYCTLLSIVCQLHIGIEKRYFKERSVKIAITVIEKSYTIKKFVHAWFEQKTWTCPWMHDLVHKDSRIKKIPVREWCVMSRSHIDAASFYEFTFRESALLYSQVAKILCFYLIYSTFIFLIFSLTCSWFFSACRACIGVNFVRLCSICYICKFSFEPSPDIDVQAVYACILRSKIILFIKWRN